MTEPNLGRRCTRLPPNARLRRRGLALILAQAFVVAAPSTASAEASAGADFSTSSVSAQKASTQPPGAEFELGGGAFRRTLRYNDDIFNRLQSYTLKAGPWVGAEAVVYPLALAERGSEATPLGWFGLEGSYGMAVGLESERFEGEEFETSSRAYSVGLRARVPVGASRFVVSAKYGGRSFEVGDASQSSPLFPAQPGVPSADYRFIRFGVSFEYQAVPSLTLVTRLGYRGLLDSGDIGTDSWFPNETSGGLDAGMQLRFDLGGGLDARVGFELERYFFSLNPEVGDERVAGGALDQYLAVSLGVGYTL